MPELPVAWPSLCLAVFLLGVRHGLDPDHLAAIDALTRLSHSRRRRFAASCGALFAIGHGMVVLSIAGAVGAVSDGWAPPHWFNLVGAWISIALLVMLGVANLRAAATTPANGVVRLVGIKSSLLTGAFEVRSAWAVAGVGALFALSFDTLSQAALFAATATRFGGIERALGMAGIFLLGMLITDGLNGRCVAHLINRTDGFAASASRVIAVVVASVSLLVAAIGAAKLMSPAFDRWSDAQALSLGFAVIAATTLGCLFARHGHRSIRIAARNDASTDAFHA